MAVNLIVLCLLLVVHPLMTAGDFKEKVAEERQLVSELGLTDLCLFTEARYVRHLSQADLHSPFQDHPLALEHSPSGSLVLPPVQLERHNDFLTTENAENAEEK
jgi:hypothetical protein